MRHFTIVQELLDKTYVNEQIGIAIQKGKELLNDSETGEYAIGGGTANAIKRAIDLARELRGIGENHAGMQMEHLVVLMENTEQMPSVVPPLGKPVEVPEFELEEHTPEEKKMDEVSEAEFEKSEKEVKKKGKK